MKRSALLLASAAALALPASAQRGYPPATGAVVTDLAGVLTVAQEDSIGALVATLRQSREVDARVVTVGSVRDFGTGDATIESFATGLFNAWDVGGAPRNDGMLLVVAVADRKVRIELGDAAEASLDARAQAVIDQRMLPAFRAGDYGDGVVRGVEGMLLAYRDALPAEATGPAARQPDYYIPPPREIPTGDGSGLWIAGALGGAVAVAGGAGAVARHRRRKCAHCGTQMARLDEAGDDVHLDSGQRLEEMLRSVDYDVWKCGSCGNHAVLPYRAWFSGNRDCPHCRYRTVVVKRRTLQRATYDHGGREEVTQDCRHCDYHDVDVVSTPRLQRSTSSSSSGGSRSFSSGGSSSGRGASGSW
ncbi:MAG TPA: TPM domain-containing protein [Longimicrobium sp.]|nr:TPM domain-containing protein [Longimicrobium sp.]